MVMITMKGVLRTKSPIHITLRAEGAGGDALINSTKNLLSCQWSDYIVVSGEFHFFFCQA